MEILKVEFRLLKENGVIALSSRHQKEYITNYIDFFKDETPFAELKRLFSLLNGKWMLQFFSPAFDLSRVLFEFQILDSTTLSDIIDFTSHKNTTLTISDIYQDRKNPNRYLGFLIVPTNRVSELKTFLLKFQNNGHIILDKFSSITDIRKNTSLGLYQPGKGWFYPSSTYLSKVKQFILSIGSDMLEQSMIGYHDDLYIPETMNTKWNYRNHPRPHQIIELYCRIAKEFSFMELPISSRKSKSPDSLTINEIGLLKQLYYNRVVYPVFIPYQIVFEFSLNNYCTFFPNIPFNRLKELIKIVPFSEIFFTDELNCMLGRLTPRLVNWIRSDLGWDVHMIGRVHKKPIELNPDWFNKRLLSWVVPEVLIS
jgi:hypothetical protein